MEQRLQGEVAHVPVGVLAALHVVVVVPLVEPPPLQHRRLLFRESIFVHLQARRPAAQRLLHRRVPFPLCREQLRQHRDVPVPLVARHPLQQLHRVRLEARAPRRVVGHPLVLLCPPLQPRLPVRPVELIIVRLVLEKGVRVLLRRLACHPLLVRDCQRIHGKPRLQQPPPVALGVLLSGFVAVVHQRHCPAHAFQLLDHLGRQCRPAARHHVRHPQLVHLHRVRVPLHQHRLAALSYLRRRHVQAEQHVALLVNLRRAGVDVLPALGLVQHQLPPAEAQHLVHLVLDGEHHPPSEQVVTLPVPPRRAQPRRLYLVPTVALALQVFTQRMAVVRRVAYAPQLHRLLAPSSVHVFLRQPVLLQAPLEPHHRLLVYRLQPPAHLLLLHGPLLLRRVLHLLRQLVPRNLGHRLHRLHKAQSPVTHDKVYRVPVLVATETVEVMPVLVHRERWGLLVMERTAGRQPPAPLLQLHPASLHHAPDVGLLQVLYIFVVNHCQLFCFWVAPCHRQPFSAASLSILNSQFSIS